MKNTQPGLFGDNSEIEMLRSFALNIKALRALGTSPQGVCYRRLLASRRYLEGFLDGINLAEASGIDTAVRQMEMMLRQPTDDSGADLPRGRAV